VFKHAQHPFAIVYADVIGDRGGPVSVEQPHGWVHRAGDDCSPVIWFMTQPVSRFFHCPTFKGNSVIAQPRRNSNWDTGADQPGQYGHPIAWGAIAGLTATVLLSMLVLVALIATL
jgi:hypothetical protein